MSLAPVLEPALDLCLHGEAVAAEAELRARIPELEGAALGQAWLLLGEALEEQFRPDDAIEALRAGHAVPDLPPLLHAALAAYLARKLLSRSQGDPWAARALIRDLPRPLPEPDPADAWLHVYADVHLREALGESTSERYQGLRHSLALLERADPPRPLMIARVEFIAGLCAHERKRPEAARAHLQRCVTLRRAHLPEDHQFISYALHHLAVLDPDPARSRQLLEVVASRLERRLGKDAHIVGVTWLALANLEIQAKNFERGEMWIRQVERLTRLEGEDPAGAIGVLGARAVLHLARREDAQARALLTTALERKAEHPTEHPDDLQGVLRLWFALYRQAGLLAEAAVALERLLALFERGPTPDRVWMVALNLLSECRYRAGRLADAEALLRKAVARGERALGKDASELLPMVSNLAGILAERRSPEAKQWKRRSERIVAMNQ